MYPHERSLVTRMKDRPFALIGVNSDPDLEQLRARCAEEKITWRSFWDESTEGPIATRWNISGWPTIFVIDHKGVIRERDVRDAALDSWVDRLVRAAEEEAEASGE